MKQSLTASFLLNSALFFAAPAAAEEPPAIEITVRVYNYAAAPASEVARAQHSASVIFAHSGVQLTWLTGTVDPELYRRTRPATRCGPAVLSLRLLPEHMEPKGGLPKGIFGFSRMAAGGGFCHGCQCLFRARQRHGQGQTVASRRLTRRDDGPRTGTSAARGQQSLEVGPDVWALGAAGSGGGRPRGAGFQQARIAQVAEGRCGPDDRVIITQVRPLSAYTIKSLLNLGEYSNLQPALASESAGMM